MTRHVIVSSLIALAAGAGLAAMQAGSGSTATPAKPPAQTSGKALTLSGCIQPGEGDAQPTFVDTTEGRNGTKYRLSGTDVKRYVGKRVKITGGLLPSPNMAAQAGAIDPSAAATVGRGGAAAGTGGTGAAPFEFRVRKVVPVTGACPPAATGTQK